MQSRTLRARAILKGIFILPFVFLAHVQAASAQDPRKLPPVRDVTPPGINRVYRSVEPTAVPESNLPKFTDIQVLPNGALRSGAKTIHLYGMILPDRKKLCSSSLGFKWTCGVAAFVALYNLVQSHSIACYIINENAQTILARCSVEQTDISARMLKEGWAELAEGVNIKIYIDATAQAKTSDMGIWGNGPPPISLDTGQRQY